jgi:hypothetical protein
MAQGIQARRKRSAIHFTIAQCAGRPVWLLRRQARGRFWLNAPLPIGFNDLGN